MILKLNKILSFCKINLEIKRKYLWFQMTIVRSVLINS